MRTKRDRQRADAPLGNSQDVLKPIDKLQFAKWVLKGIFVFFMMSIMVRFYQESSGETLIDICRTGLLPIASFVIGDYFGSKG